MRWHGLCAVVIGVVTVAEELNIGPPIRIGAWNIQRFGKAKMAKTEVVKILVQVVRRYDLLAVMEIRDKSEHSPVALLHEVNSGLTDTYNVSLSSRVGSERNKEQYAVYWKPSRITVDQSYTYWDAEGLFTYDPYLVVAELRGPSSHTTTPVKFGLVIIHTSPSLAVQEVSNLVHVHRNFKKKVGLNDIMIAGDYNAGCSYITSNEWQDVALFTDPAYTWLIDDHADTTTKTTTCPYDRIVVSGEALMAAVYPDTAQPYYYDEDLGITSQDLITGVSDHYPVEVLLRPVVPPVSVSLAVGVSVVVQVSHQDLSTLQNSLLCYLSSFTMVKRWAVRSQQEAVAALTSFSMDNPKILPIQVVQVLGYKVSEGALQDPSLHGAWQQPALYSITMLCEALPPLCSFTVHAPTTLT